jgi:hypothetical protein
MEATVFIGWIYNHLKPYVAALKVAHPLMLRAIAGAQQDLRLPALRFSAGVLHGPTAIRKRRRTLRYRNDPAS